jgi:hypothetical protein
VNVKRIVERWIILNVLGLILIAIIGFEWSYVIGWMSGALVGSVVVERI